jgi:hypothetical protein
MEQETADYGYHLENLATLRHRAESLRGASPHHDVVADNLKSAETDLRLAHAAVDQPEVRRALHSNAAGAVKNAFLSENGTAGWGVRHKADLWSLHDALQSQL